MTNIQAVIGANYGDEGKGLMTDYFANCAISNNENCIVVCNNGGAQRGHTVVTPDGIRHVFHHFGSGTLVGADTYLSAFFVVNPMIFMSEYQELKDCNTNVYLNPNCLCSLPYDMMLNQIIEESRGHNRHGSCGVGIWETILRNGLTIGQMANLSDKCLKHHLIDVREHYVSQRIQQKDVCLTEDWRDLLYSNGLIEHYILDFRNMINKTNFANDDVLIDYQNIIFENGQGLLLDQNCGDIHHSTPSNTGAKNIHKVVSKLFTDYTIEYCYVSRTYMTRHGNGEFPTECIVDNINSDIYDTTNVPNLYQGVIRYGHLNFQEMANRILKDCKPYLVGGKAYCSIAMTHINEYQIPSNGIYPINYVSNGETRENVFAVN